MTRSSLLRDDYRRLMLLLRVLRLIHRRTRAISQVVGILALRVALLVRHIDHTSRTFLSYQAAIHVRAFHISGTSAQKGKEPLRSEVRGAWSWRRMWPKRCAAANRGFLNLISKVKGVQYLPTVTGEQSRRLSESCSSLKESDMKQSCRFPPVTAAFDH